MKQVSKHLATAQVPLFNCHLCFYYLNYDPGTIRISISITWELVRRENRRPLLDLLTKNLHLNFARTSYTHSSFSGTGLSCLQHPDLSRSLFQYLWSRENNFYFTSLLWWLITWMCKSAVFGVWHTWQPPPHTHTHRQTGAWNKTARKSDWVGREGKWERWNKMIITGTIVGILEICLLSMITVY